MSSLRNAYTRITSIYPPYCTGQTEGSATIQDNGTSSAPISILGNEVPVQLTNDGQGLLTEFDLPQGVTSIYNDVTDELDFSELQIGDQIDIRIDTIVSGVGILNNTTIIMEFGDINNRFQIPILDEAIGDSIFGYDDFGLLLPFNKYVKRRILLADDNMRLNPARILLKSSQLTDCIVRGYLLNIIR